MSRHRSPWLNQHRRSSPSRSQRELRYVLSNTGMHGFDGDSELAIGSVFGLRQWRTIDAARHNGFMASWGLPGDARTMTGLHGSAWTPGENVATCTVRHGGQILDPHPVNPPGHRPPHERCGCGFWAYWTAASTFAQGMQGTADTEVTGVIEGYGLTLIGANGFRCEKARILGICVQGTDQALVAHREMVLADYYQVTPYATIGWMMHEHPLTTEYLHDLPRGWKPG